MKKFASKVIQLTCLIFIVSAFSNVTSLDRILGAKDLKKNKIALIITINEYQENSGWSSINANNDAPLVKYALMQQGFEEKDIAIIQNEAATKAGIFKAIEDHLIKKAKSGGVAVFHFSGHGQQVQDQNDDELDGYDEAIVPYDSPMHFQKGVYEGENLIRDEELGNLMTRLRKKLGKNGNLLLILDSCHSGTGTRGLATARGTDIIMADSGYINSNKNRVSNDRALDKAEGVNEEKLASMAAFFGSSADELNYETISAEGKEVGSLSYAFSQTFADASKEMTYQSVFEQITIRMSTLAPRQTPQAEGQLDQQILGGKILGKLKYFKLSADDYIYGQELSLSSGILSNLFPGTKVGVYPDGTRDLSKAIPIAEGVVKEAEMLSCLIELNNAIGLEELRSCRIFVIEQHYGDLSVHLKIDLEESDLKTDLIQNLAEFPMIKVVKDQPDLLLETKPSKEEEKPLIQLITNDEYQLFLSDSKASTARIVRQITETILEYVQCKFLRTLEMKETELDVRLTFISLEKKANGFQEDSNNSDEMNRFRVGDKFKLEIQNHGSLGAYYTVLDIQPDNKIGVLIPNNCSKRTAKELYIEPGEKQEFDCIFEAYPPLGTDVLKLIATPEPLDLTTIESSRGQSDLENSHPFEIFFAASYFYNNRGAGNFSLFPEISIFSKVFVIEE